MLYYKHTREYITHMEKEMKETFIFVQKKKKKKISENKNLLNFLLN